MKPVLFCALLMMPVACSDDPDTPVDPEPEWSAVLDRDDLDRVVLSAWGSSPTNVYVAGGDLESGGRALLMRYDGDAWREIDTGSTETFWWVWGPEDGGDEVYAVGEGGVIYHVSGGVATQMTSPTTLTLFGVWGQTTAELWAVGGDPLAVDPTPVILRFDGTDWIDETPQLELGGALFKVWGNSASDVYAVGQSGTIVHYDGATWTTQDSGTDVTLFTVHSVGPGAVYAVGGPPAQIVEYDGSAWSIVDTGVPASVWNGVAAAPDGTVIAVGQGGVKARLSGGEWIDDSLSPPFDDLHAAWLDPSGVAYVVGGNYLAPSGSQRIGSVGYYGTEPPPEFVSTP